MATPKKKMSHHRSRQRRAINLRIKGVTGIVKCKNCHESGLPHRVCLNCGYYRGKKID